MAYNPHLKKAMYFWKPKSYDTKSYHMCPIFVKDLPDALEPLARLFADDVRMVTPRMQNINLHSSLSDVWDWLQKGDLPTNPALCNYLTIGREVPLRLSFSPMGLVPLYPHLSRI